MAAACDFCLSLPDEVLACIFQPLSSGDRKRCSLVCRRWLTVEGQTRHRLSLNAQSDLTPLVATTLFNRFDSVTKLALKCDRRSISIGDDTLELISLRCPNLTRLKLRTCRELTDLGMIKFAKNCKGLRKLSCGSCMFGYKGMNAVLDNCVNLEELSIKRLRGIADASANEQIGPGIAASSLKTICLKELYNGLCFAPLIAGSKNLKTLKLFRCSGDWDGLLQEVAERVTGLVEIHLEKLHVSDVGLTAISRCLELEIMHLVKTPDCTDSGLVSIAEHCKLLRKLHIDGCKANRIGDEGLVAVARNCPSLQELVLIGVNTTKYSLSMLSSNCLNLERLALCSSDTVGDAEITCIAEKCVALKKLCIKSCPISDDGIEALVVGCPNLIKVKLKKCRGLTTEGVNLLRTVRESVSVSLDTGEIEHPDPNASEGGPHDNGVEFPPLLLSEIAAPNIMPSSSSRSFGFKSRLGLFSGRRFVACTLRRWSSTRGH
ncbi:hypothetical protein ACFE04_005733 [Oxalis oulophora]